MGSCLSRKQSNGSCLKRESAVPAVLEADQDKAAAVQVGKKTKETKTEEESIKKEIFVIKHRKSHDTRPEEKTGLTRLSEQQPQIFCNTTSAVCGNFIGGGEDTEIAAAAAPVRTSSCTREEVDAILIQCGRLSRSSSGKAATGSCGSRKYSGSKRSYDFDRPENDGIFEPYVEKSKSSDSNNGSEDQTRQSRSRSSSSQQGGGRRRTPSREREQQPRSGSRERTGIASGSGRRVSRSPGRRSETPCRTNGAGKPGKMVSVPATVSNSMPALNKSSNEPTPIRRVTVKRNVMSPRSQSPAKGRHSNQNPSSQQQPSLNRSSSRKAEQSPLRTDPLNEVDTNAIAIHQPSFSKNASQVLVQKPTMEDIQSSSCKITSRSILNNKVVVMGQRAKEEEQHHQINEPRGPQSKASNIETPTVIIGADILKPQTLTISRSSRRSRDFDFNHETLQNPTPNASYNTILLEDIKNFHQKSHNTSFSLPPCLTKACSILDAVADLNSSTSSLLFSEDGKSYLVDQSGKNNSFLSGTSLVARKESEARDPFVESVLAVDDDITEPSLHKYVTLRRCTVVGGGQTEEQESSGSNSFAGWDSSWEPNSADSTDCWSSRSNTREEHLSTLGFQRHVLEQRIDQ